MKRIVAVGVAIALSITSISPAKGNPALLAPAAGLCGTGIGCILIGTVVISGVLYYVYTHQGRKVYVPVNRENNRFGSRAISSEQTFIPSDSISGTQKGDRFFFHGVIHCYYKPVNPDFINALITANHEAEMKEYRLRKELEKLNSCSSES